ncbi:hypothetical protein P3342_010358 [Pyrenophora teres f. teres]|nr:hypothetical protein P3342_010358 [Pyrenophora teres f. teres]
MYPSHLIAHSSSRRLNEYMKKSPSHTETSLRQSEPDPGGNFPERHLYTPSDKNDSHSYFGKALRGARDFEGARGFHVPYSQQFGHANNFGHPTTPNIGLEEQRPNSYDPHHSAQSPQFAFPSNNTILRGIKNDVEHTSSPCQDQELRRAESSQIYMMHRRSFSVEAPMSAPMSSFPQPSSRNSSAPPQAAGHYGPFLGRFKDSADAKLYRRTRMRFGRMPWRDPEDDPTIADIELHRTEHVERIYNAMICGDYARDNAKSTALKRWVHEPHYQSDLVEAYAHKVFDCLLEQVKEGFRGWHQNDYVNDERKGEDDDKDIDCAGRLDNIITALQQEKSICENVMSSAWQIRMFVNAPKAYSKRKDQNRVGNSKRPNARSTEVPDDNPRAVKRPRVRQTRTQPSAEVPVPRDTPPQRPYEPNRLPYFTTPATQRSIQSPPTSAFRAPTMQPSSRPNIGSLGQGQLSLMSPPVLSQTIPRTPQSRVQTLSTMRTPSVPPLDQFPFSPSTAPYSNFSASPTPGNVKPAHPDQHFNSWQYTTAVGDFPYDLYPNMNPVGTSEFPAIEEWQHDVFTFPTSVAPENANLFAHHPEMGVSLCDVEGLPSNSEDDVAFDNEYQIFWQQQKQRGVQQPPHNGLPPESPHQR